MVDADAVDQPVLVQAKVEGVGAVEHRLILDAQPGKFADGEEAAPVELVIGGLPRGEPVMLPIDQLGGIGGRSVVLVLVADRKPVLAIGDQMPAVSGTLHRDLSVG